MTINSIQFFNKNNKYVIKNNKTYSPQFGRLPSLDKLDMHKNPVFIADMFLKKNKKFLDKFSPNNCSNLSSIIEFFKNKNAYLRKIINNSPRKVAKDTIPIAEKLKTFLDDKFNKKYIFVSIGRSPVTIGRTLEFMGVPVKYIPISELHTLSARLGMYSAKGVENYIAYIKNLGLNEKFLSKTGQKAVFYDYSYTGATISSMKHFIKHYVGLPPKYFDFRELNTDLLNLAKNEKEKNKIETFISNYLFRENAEKYSHIPSLKPCDVGNINEIMDAFIFPEKALFFNKNLILLLKKKGLLIKK